jgi:competence protein ComEC
MKRWPKSDAFFWQTAPFFRLLLPCIAAIVAYDSMLLPSVPVSTLLVTTISAVLLLIVTTFIPAKSIYIRLLDFLCINLAVFSTVLLLCLNQDVTRSNNWFAHDIPKASSFAVVVNAAPTEKSNSIKIPVTVIGSIHNKVVHPTTGNALIYLFKFGHQVAYHIGDTLIVPPYWKPIRNSGNPFEFDYARFAAHNGLYWQQSIAPADVCLSGKGNPQQLSLLQQLHDYCNGIIHKYITNASASGLLQALLLGDESSMDPDLRQSYAATGIIHWVAISGSHITSFFWLITLLLSFIRHNRYQWLKYLLAVPLIWAYVCIAGAPPSAVRAAIMFSLLAIGLAFQKHHNPLNTLFATAFLLLCAQPQWLFSVGFQLSFAAVLSITVCYTPLYALFQPKNKILRSAWSVCSLSFAAELFTAPIVAFYFHMFPAVFLLSNLAAAVAIGCILFLGAGLLLFSSLPVIASSIAFIITYITSWFNMLNDYFRSLNPVSFYFISLSTLQLLLLYVIIVATLIFLLSKSKTGLFSGLAMLCIFLSTLCFDEYTSLQQHRVVTYNMGSHYYTEVLRGKKFSIIASDVDSLPNNKASATAAHIGWHCWHGTNHTKQDIAVTNNQILLSLHHILPPSCPAFPAHILLINHPLRLWKLKQLQQVFHPVTIIAAGKQFNATIKKWEKECQQSGIDFCYIKDSCKLYN